MSGQQALTIVGQVVGGYIFGPIGAAIGGAIGGVVGGLLFAKDVVTEGPRLTDVRLQTSTYGQAIPIVKGTVRVAGNVIWASEVRESVHETEQGGKGGDTATLREFTYDMDVAIALCEGVTVEIERIFANGILIYDTRVGASPATVFASGQWATSTFLYTGTETQLPDPTIEAAVGVGNAPGYRGTSYLMITGLQLNVLRTSVLPNFEFVVVQSGTVTQFARSVLVDNLSPRYRDINNLSQPWPRVTINQGVVRIDNDADANVYLYDLSGAALGTTSQNGFEAGRPPTSLLVGAEYEYGFWLMFDGSQAWTRNTVAQIRPVDLFIGSSTASSLVAGSPTRAFVSMTQCADNRTIIALVRDDTATYADEWIRMQWTGSALVILDRGPVTPSLISIDLGSPTAAYNHYQASFGESDLRTIWNASGNADLVKVYQIDNTGTLVLLNTFSGIGQNLVDSDGSGPNPSVYADNGIATIVAGDRLLIYTRIAAVTPVGPTLSTVVNSLCVRAGIDTGELDTTALGQTVDGFVIGTTMTARAAIDALRPAYYFDAIDGDKLKFVVRGAAADGTFADEDLGAGVGESAKALVTVQIAQETELPSRLNVRYISIAADYQLGAQSSRRETTESQEVLDIDVPVVLTDALAAQVADVNMRDQWSGSTVRTFATGIRYSKYEPTDVILLDDGDAIRTVRLTRRIDRGALIEWESRDEDQSLYDSNAIGMSITVPLQTLSIAGPTDIELLDLPPLTELASGSESALYGAARGFTSGWTGTTIDISRDGGSVFTAATNLSTASIMGTATAALPNFLGGNVFDEVSTVRVNLAATATLSSTTHDLVLAGANAALLGDEIIQFRTASLISAGVYDLTGFLRGRKGTEWAMGTHAASERFVMLTTNLANVPMFIGDASSTSLLVRATSAGSFAGSAPAEAFTTQLARLKPYSPVHLSATRDAATADWLLTWVRRDRYMNDWNSGVDVPMSESSKLYDVEVVSGSTVLATYTDVSTESQAVPAAVLGYSPTPDSISFRVYQKSAVVGRGFVATNTVTQAL